MEKIIIALVSANILTTFGGIFYTYWKFKKSKTKESEFYTDYVKGTNIMRVYKPEFEFQAIGNLPPSKILDVGRLSVYYNWALIDERR